ncbi:MAG: acyl-CoA dehydratase activase [Dehalococcoidales bacterium]|jgi:predicted CoA-substrate-specific enzyme activase|nr:acyl-CoA dehydratase activase [Dehalococcoidales bacterium]MDX9802780.1 acyl-CoA dehydratase activase [Dehalococcoidales bacterium]
MIYAGIDIGSRAAKAVLLQDDTIVSSVIRDTGAESVKTSQALLKELLVGTGIEAGEIDYTVATGYGRVLVPYANENVSEISAHAKGINWYFPQVRTILDMGGQDCKAINCDGEGNVTNFVMNDKCAGGTGRFLEMIAEVLNIPLEEIGSVSLSSNGGIPFNTICAVFAKTEALGHLRKGVSRADILAGLHEAIATRSYNLLRRVSLEPGFAITGGISKNSGLVAKISQKVQMDPLLCADPQLCGALGAALYARNKSAIATPGVKMQYGYDDGTGSYFISIDEELCSGCGKCVDACPAGIFTMSRRNGRIVAEVKEEARKRLPILCPGVGNCRKLNSITCQAVCGENAIEHSW